MSVDSGRANGFQGCDRMKYWTLLSAAALLLSSAQVVESKPVQAPPAPNYADLADLALTAPIAAHVRIAGIDRLSAEEAASAPPGHRRFLIDADVVALIRAPDGLPARVRYLIDLPNDSRGRPAELRRRSEWLILAQRSGARSNELRLATPDAQLAYAPETAERLRAILREANAPAAAPRITGIGRAFHVPGSLAGESETQIFLQTAGGQPISLAILRRPGETPRWSVALSEIVDEAAPSPGRDTLLWYRLACTLPATLPRDSLREASADEARAINADYRLVMAGLGSCGRTRAWR